MDEKLIDLVRKCEELYDMSNKKYSESVWKEKNCGDKSVNSLKNQVSFNVFIAHFEFTIILLITEVLTINK